MKEQGILIKIEGNSASVRLSMGGGCGSCGSKDACASGSTGKRTISAVVAEGLSAKPGDAVVLEIPDRVQLVGILWFGLLPLALFAAGYAGAGRIFGSDSEGLSALGGMLGIAVGLVLAALVSRRGSLAARPVIVSVESGTNADAACETCAGCKP